MKIHQKQFDYSTRAVDVVQHRLNYTKILDPADEGGGSKAFNREVNRGSARVFDKERVSNTQPPDDSGDLDGKLKNGLM